MYEGDRVAPAGLNRTGEVWDIPGHTRHHIAFVFAEAGLVFAGDTLFAGGCGRLFEGTPAQMNASLHRLATLPDATRVYCAHEYTLKNLAFAAEVEPDNEAVRQRLRRAEERRAADQPTIPTTIAEEKRTNPFLRVDEPAVREAVRGRGAEDGDPDAVFAALRAWKDRF